MIIAFWCVLIAGVLPLACAYVAKFGPRDPDAASTGRFDNREPRAWLARQTGRRSRANAAQANSWEAFAFFGLGVVIAILQHVPVDTVNLLAVVFIVARVAYIACYLGNVAAARSFVWFVGFAASVGLYLVAATGTLR
jgi:uncharacterized MAPEG superfamily protein